MLRGYVQLHKYTHTHTPTTTTTVTILHDDCCISSRIDVLSCVNPKSLPSNKNIGITHHTQGTTRHTGPGVHDPFPHSDLPLVKFRVREDVGMRLYLFIKSSLFSTVHAWYPRHCDVRPPGLYAITYYAGCFVQGIQREHRKQDQRFKDQDQKMNQCLK